MAMTARESLRKLSYMYVDARKELADAENRIVRLRQALDLAADNGVTEGAFEYILGDILKLGDWTPKHRMPRIVPLPPRPNRRVRAPEAPSV